MRAPAAFYRHTLSVRFTYRLLAIAAFFFLFARPGLAQSDTTPPSLVSLSFSTTNLNVSSAAQQLTVNATATDNLSGVSYISFSFTSPSSSQTFYTALDRTAGTTLSGTYSGTVAFPLFAEAGDYTAGITLYDFAGNHLSLDSATLANLGFPSTINLVDTNPDTTPPVLLGATFSPTSLNASNGPQTATVSLHITDSQTGVSFAYTDFSVVLSPAGGNNSGPFYYIANGQFSLVSGTPQNGVWQTVVTIPRYAGGNFTFNQINLRDVVGNSIHLGSAQISDMGINSVLATTSQPTDSTPPALHSFSITPSIVDTSASTQTLNLTLAASDDLSGVDFTPTTPYLAYIMFGFYSPSGNQVVYINPYDAPAVVAGNSLSGTYRLSFSLPQYSEQGTWSLGFASLKDKTGNVKNLTPADIQAMGFATTFVVTKPSLTPDGTIGPGGGTVTDNAFGTRASITFPAGLVSQPTTVSLDVFPTPLPVPTPSGFTMPGTYFENVSFVAPLPEPVPSPGITVVLPLLTPMNIGAALSLYHIDPVIGLAPAMNAFGHPVVGTVNSDRLSATFHNVVTFSTLVAYLSNGSLLGDVSGDGRVNCTDVSILKSSFGKSRGQPGFNAAADLNNDGTVNVLDQFIISRQLPTGLACH